MMMTGDIQGLGQFSRPRTKLLQVAQTAPASHDGNSTGGFERPNQDEPVSVTTLNQDIEHPMNAIIEINVGRAGMVSSDERPGTWPGKGVSGFVVLGQICLCLNDDSGAAAPDQSGTDQTGSAD